MNPCGNNRAVTGGSAGITAGTICWALVHMADGGRDDPSP
jgi:hypothetical protein